MKCISINCPKYQTCAHATSPLLGGSDYMYINNTSCTTLETIYACGPIGDYALYEPAITATQISSDTRTNPTRVCAICTELESNSEIVKDEFWVCPDCLHILRNIVLRRKQ